MNTRKSDWLDVVGVVIGIAALVAIILAIVAGPGQAAPMAPPFIPDGGIKDSIITVWDPGHPDYKLPGVVTLKDVTTQKEYDIALIWCEYGSDGGTGIFRSALPLYSGTQVIVKAMMSDGREVDTNGQDVFTSILYKLYLPLDRFDKQVIDVVVPTRPAP